MRDFWRRKLLSGGLAAIMAFSAFTGGLSVSAHGTDIGTPYRADGSYDVSVPHVLVNQVFGGSDDGAADHSFIELYNPCDQEVDLNGWELQYRSSEDGEDAEWHELILNGVIPAKGYYLIRCGKTDGSDYAVPEGDQEWELSLHNKGLSVALFSRDVTLNGSFSGNVTDESRPDGYVDLLAVQGNDAEDSQIPPVYETAFAPEQSKKKAVRREDFADTDDNSADIEIVDYSKSVDADKGPHNSKMPAGGSDNPDLPTAEPFRTASFEENAKLTLELLSSVSVGTPDADGGVAEIAAYNSDREELYVVNGQDGLLYRLSLSADGLTVAGSEDLRYAAKDFTYGDMTSVAVDSVHDRIAVALQAEEYTESGRILLLDYDFNTIASYTVGVQPDMVTFTHDGELVLSANEGEPRQGYGDGAVDPAGSISIVDLSAGNVTTVGFEAFDSDKLAAEGVLIGVVNGRRNEAVVDLEPEYIAVSADDTRAYVSLQEANAIAAVDLRRKTVISIKSMGFKDLSLAENAVDLTEDGRYESKTYPNAVGVYMPDAISLFEANGMTYLVTANEGDSREWGADENEYVNEAKTKLQAADGTEAEKVRTLDKACTTVPDETKEYLFGGRSFAIYEADTMRLVYESGSEFEEKTAEYLPSWFNCSNDNIDADDRSAKKGPEPEAVTVGEIGGRSYAFIALERIGGVMIYDVTDPVESVFVNYINTRDFSEEIAGDDSPEGLCFLTLDGEPILVAACEVSGTVAAYTFGGPANSGDTVILYTNDVHCAMENYAAFAAYRRQLLDAGIRTITVDAGDAVQGEVIGTLTSGSAIVEIMNSTGYDYAVPGNHEFDYGMEIFMQLSGQLEAEIEPAYEYLSANFIDLIKGEPVFQPYVIRRVAGRDIAFVGISTPETYTKSTPAYFQDENGNDIYSFCEETFYETVQGAVDKALDEGAELVIAVGHLGTDAASEPWRSTDVIANTTGIDAFIDAHSHSVIEEQAVRNQKGETVLLTSAGTKFEFFGKMTVSEDGTITAELLRPETIDVDATASSAAAYGEVQAVIEKYEEMQSFTYEELGSSEADLTTVNPETGERIIRNQETNLGNFVADAYRAATGAEIAFANGGGIRADLPAGTVTRKNLMDVNAFGNTICVLSVTGRQILDALEWGAHAPLNADGTALTENGGFLQVSGLTYEINLHVAASPVLTDSQGVFVGIDAEMPRRVQNVRINGEPIDPQATYTLAGSAYTLQSGGDGYTMFQGAETVQADCGKDHDLLIRYLQEDLNGVIPEDLYGNPCGEGRIKILTADTESAHRYAETERVEATKEKDGYVRYICDLCGEEKIEVLPKLTDGSEPSDPDAPIEIPETGDSGVMTACIFLLLCSAAALRGAAVSRRKRDSDAG